MRTNENNGLNLKLQKKSNPKREYWVDLIRVSIVLFVVLYHVLCDFSEDLYLRGYPFVWNETFIDGIGWFLMFFDSWQMHILFLLAGFSMVYSLQKRTYKDFMKERVSRLGIPLIFGYIIWIAISSFVSLQFFWKYHPELASYLFKVDTPPSFGTYYIWWWWVFRLVNSGHLWFLLALLPLNLIGGKIVSSYFAKKEKEFQDKTHSKNSSMNNGQTEPIKSTRLSFGSIGDPASIQDKTKMTKITEQKPVVDTSKSIIFHPAMMLLYGAIGAQIDALSLWIPIGAFQYSQIIFFGLGISLAIHIQYLKVIQKHCKWTFPVALVLIIGYILLVKIGVPESAVHSVRVIGSFYLVYSLIGLLSKYVLKPFKIIKYLSKASMSIYILHLPLLNIIGFFLCPITFNPLLKICVLFLLDIGVCLVIYEIIKRINFKPLQLCIGIKS
ncbi:MAG: acyltransferase family protein [Promethearchaeota archaeon]